MMKRMQIRQKDIKLLWGRGGNRCAMPNCRIELSSNERGGAVLGVMAHIAGEKPGAARWDATLTAAERNSYDNLILLCPTHHAQIDSDPAKWTVDCLMKIKAEHEERFAISGRAQVTEFEGVVDVHAKGGDLAVGVTAKKPTRFKPGTSIRVDTTDTRKTLGLQM